jgi:phage gp29-like protein
MYPDGATSQNKATAVRAVVENGNKGKGKNLLE